MKDYAVMDEIYSLLLASDRKSVNEKFQDICKILVTARSLEIQRCCIMSILDYYKFADSILGKYRIVAGVAEIGPEHSMDKDYPINSCPPIMEILETQSTLAIANVSSDPRTSSYLSGLIENIDLKSVLFVPIIIKGEVAHTIVCDAIRGKKEFSAANIDFVTRIAERISQIKHYERLIKHTNRLEAISRTHGVLKHELRNPMTTAFSFARRAFSIAIPNITNRQILESLNRYGKAFTEEASRSELILQQCLKMPSEDMIRCRHLELSGILPDIIKKLGKDASIVRIKDLPKTRPVMVDAVILCDSLIVLLDYAIRKTKTKPEAEIEIEIASKKRSAELSIIYPANGKKIDPSSLVQKSELEFPGKNIQKVLIAKSMLESMPGVSSRAASINGNNHTIISLPF